MNADDRAPWPALVLAAGLATRLRPLSLLRAKAAMPVAGEPLVGRVLRWLRASGIQDVIVNLHHRADTITAVIGDGSDWDVRVRYSWEPTVLGSAGGPKRALRLLTTKRLLIVNADTLTDCNLSALVDEHLQSGARVTMAVVPRREERAVVADAEGRVTGFGPGDDHFIGVQAVNTDVFDAVDEDTSRETVQGLYPQLVAAQPGAVRVYRSNAEFLDVGTAADYLETAMIVAAREGRELDRGPGGAIHPTAHVRDSILWKDVQVHAYARLTRCIVGDGVVVPANARYERSVLVKSAAGLSVTPL